MLEIKNIVNREIDGIPKKEYWIQMQLQMETCDLNECDFLETKFTEYESENEFLNDSDNDNCSFTKTMNNELKGVFMYFTTSEGKPHYVYKPLDMELEEFEKWSENIMNDLCDEKPDENGVKKIGMCWIKNIYWKLEEVSCVLVLRNQKWFADNINQLKNIWTTIEKERISGEFSHRAPNKRTKKIVEPLQVNKIENYFNLGPNSINIQIKKTDCLIPLHKHDN